MNHLEIKHLKLVRAIAETGNMTRAAEKLFLTQSALSQQLKDIEGKLGVDLFFRTSKKMILTPIGKRLMDTAKLVIAAVEEAELEIAKTVSGDRGELKMGVQCIFCYKWLPRVMEEFHNRFPNIDIEIGTSHEPAEELEKKKFDFIVTASGEKDNRFTYVPLFADQMMCIMAQDHPLGEQLHVRFSDFGRFNLIAHAERGRNRFFQAVLQTRGIEPRRYMAVEQPQAVVELVRSGFGISVFPAWAIREAVREGQITARPLTPAGLPLTWQAVLLPNGQIPSFQQEFINIIGRMDIPSSDLQPLTANTSA